MGLNLSKLVANRAPCSVDFGDGDVLHIEYYPKRLTSRMLVTVGDVEKLEALGKSDPARALAIIDSPTEALCTLLGSWDFTEGEDEQPMPLDREHIARLGIEIQWTILGAIIKDSKGEAKAPEDKASAAPSGGTSVTA